MKPPYTFEEILVILEAARMDDVSQRLRELWAEMAQDNSSRWNASLRQDIRNLIEERDTLRTRLAEVEKDAERYRWLRECPNDALVLYGDTYNCELMMEEALDEAVDKAMKEQP